MTLTLLIDLDDTLLTNPIDSFLDQYFKELGKALAAYVEPERMMQAMAKAVQAMQTKTDLTNSMEDTFNRVFYPAIGIPRADLIEELEDFYRARFPLLASLTSPRPEAARLLHNAFERGWQVVIATNPLFPATAVHQRLAWAGFPPDEYPFAWIASFETSHFCKPNPAYYAELLAFLRWPESPAVMVGNDWENDILPAEALGLPTFWLCENDGLDYPPTRHPASSQGSEDRLGDWLLGIEQDAQLLHFDTVPAIKATLTTTPAALTTFTRSLDQQKWNLRPLKDEWSLTEILCHLRDVDREVNLPRIHTILDGNNPFIPGAVTDPWVAERNYSQECGPDALIEFSQIRAETVKLLESLDESAWQNSARHAIFGPTTLKEMLNFVATHDRSHIQQAWQAIQAVIAQ